MMQFLNDFMPVIMLMVVGGFFGGLLIYIQITGRGYGEDQPPAKPENHAN